MPIVPIHRADAGAKIHADATPMDEQPAAAAPVSVGAMTASDAAVSSGALPNQPQTDVNTMQPAAAVAPQPVHRYSFSGGGRTVPDEQGGKDALIKGDAMLDGHEAVDFNADGDGLVELPADSFAELADFSVLVWLSASSDDCWQRAFDLTFVQKVPVPASGPGAGNGGQGPGQASDMTRSELVSLYLTPYGCPDKLPTLGYVNSTSKYHLVGQKAVTQDEDVLLGLTYSAGSQTLRLLLDGELISEQRVPLDLHALRRARAWLGQSYAASDPVLDGSISELRVYASALESAALAQIYVRGPDQL
jgi:hypothetical protein